ncbi:hypothetical protein JHU87_004677 [Escherichia coli]|nr:hypothetical protein [Escherichia coli]
MLPSEIMIWQPEFTDKTLSRKPGAVHSMLLIWRPFISPRRMFTIVSKAALMAIGQGVRRAA